MSLDASEHNHPAPMHHPGMPQTDIVRWVLLGGAILVAAFVAIHLLTAKAKKGSGSTNAANTSGAPTGTENGLQVDPATGAAIEYLPTQNTEESFYAANSFNGASPVPPVTDNQYSPPPVSTGTANPAPTPEPSSGTGSTGSHPTPEPPTPAPKPAPKPPTSHPTTPAEPATASHGARPEYVTAEAWTSHPKWDATMWGIATHEHLTLSELAMLNPDVRNLNLIYPGERIRVH